MVLLAHPGIGAVTLALLFGMFNLIYGVWQLTLGIEVRRIGKTELGEAGKKIPHSVFGRRHAA